MCHKNAIYEVTCLLCVERYGGETEQCAHYRLGEHKRGAQNPFIYEENALAQHYRLKHAGVPPKLKYNIIDVQPITVRRKIVEAMYILREKPEINNKSELTYLCKYLVE